MISIIKNWGGIIFISVAIAGCGFHLRGTKQLAPQTHRINIENSKNDDRFNQSLKRGLINAGAKIVEKPRQSNLVIVIKDVQFSKVFNSVNSNVQLHNYTLHFNIIYHLQNNKLVEILPEQIISVTRSYQENANQVLGSTHEEELLITEMQQEAIQKFITRISTPQVTKHLQSSFKDSHIHEAKR